MPTRRVTDLDDPRRCMGQVTGSQCTNISEEDSDYCSACGRLVDERVGANDYLLEQFNRRVKLECGEDDAVMLLKENLMHINMLIAAHRNKVKDDATMVATAGAIADLAVKAEKLTATLHRLSMTSGLLLARPALTRWGAAIIEAVANVVKDKYDGWEDDVNDLANSVLDIIVLTKNEEGETPK